MKRIKDYIKHKKLLFNALNYRGLLNFLPDKLFLKLAFRFNVGRKLNLKKPVCYNDKLQWLKLYNRNPLYTKLVDKYEVKEYVSKIIGKEYIIPTIGVWDRFDDINFDELPQSFVLKCTHDSGGLVICKNKKDLDIEFARKKITKSLKRDYYLTNREWPYKNVNRKIIAEKYIEDKIEKDLKDYKFFCFDGKVKALFIATDRSSTSETCFDFFDRNFNHLDLENGHPNTKNKLEKPENYEKMVELAEKLSEKLPHARIDFYNVNGKIYFGEITFFHWSGLVKFVPEDWDYKFGEWLKLPKNGK